jgi:tetratricopeptide (TPR) repeat protein
MDAGRTQESIAILEQVRQRHPNNAIVLHELALAFRMSFQPTKAVALLSPYRAQLPPETLANLGSALDESGRPSDAVAVFKEGIEEYPRSGILYSELATTLAKQQQVNKSLELYKRGTEVDAAFPANYLHLATLLADTKYRGLSLIYGETFRVLEPGTQRSAEVAKMMARVCQDALVFKDKAIVVSLAPDHTQVEGDSSGGALKMPLVSAFELTFGAGLAIAAQRAPKHQLDLSSLHEARRLFLGVVRKPGAAFDWSAVPIVRWLRDLDAAGHLEAYDHWLYAPAFPEEASSWAQANGKRLEALQSYLAEHPLFAKP